MAHKGRASAAHTSAANLSPVVGNDVSPIPHGLPDVSECAHSEPKSPPKAGEGTSDDEVTQRCQSTMTKKVLKGLTCHSSTICAS